MAKRSDWNNQRLPIRERMLFQMLRVDGRAVKVTPPSPDAVAIDPLLTEAVTIVGGEVMIDGEPLIDGPADVEPAIEGDGSQITDGDTIAGGTLTIVGGSVWGSAAVTMTLPGAGIDNLAGPTENGTSFANHVDISAAAQSHNGSHNGTHNGTGGAVESFGSLTAFGNTFEGSSTRMPRPRTVKLLAVGPEAVVAGKDFSVTVTALDADGHLDLAYAGTVTLTTIDGNGPATVLAVHEFSYHDGGRYTFTGLTRCVAGVHQVAASDGMLDCNWNVLVKPGPATGLEVEAAPVARVGVPFDLVVGAVDRFRNIAMDYDGTVAFERLPVSHTFAATDEGVHVFALTLDTPGLHSLLARDHANALLAEVLVTVAE